MRRDKPKDAYDVVWLLDALGPGQASELIATSPLLTGEYANEVSDQLRRLINDQFKDTDSAGPVMYADFLEAKPGDLERRHAHGTLAAFGDALKRRDIQVNIRLCRHPGGSRGAYCRMPPWRAAPRSPWRALTGYSRYVVSVRNCQLPRCLEGRTAQFTSWRSVEVVKSTFGPLPA